MFKTFNLLAFLSIYVGVGFSQADSTELPAHYIGFEIGFSQGYLKDLNFSPLNYHEFGSLYSFSYLHQKPVDKSIFTLDIDVGLPSLKTQFSNYFTSDMTLGNIELSYVRKVIHKKVRVFLGGQYASYVQVLDWNDFESFSFLVTHGVGIKSTACYDPTPKHTFKTTLFIPVFQSLVRPPYNGLNVDIINNQDNTLKLIFDGKPASFKQYFACELDLNYAYLLSKRIDLTATYLIRYQQVSSLQAVTHFQNQLTVGAHLKF